MFSEQRLWNHLPKRAMILCPPTHSPSHLTAEKKSSTMNRPALIIHTFGSTAFLQIFPLWLVTVAPPTHVSNAGFWVDRRDPRGRLITSVLRLDMDNWQLEWSSGVEGSPLRERGYSTWGRMCVRELWSTIRITGSGVLSRLEEALRHRSPAHLHHILTTSLKVSRSLSALPLSSIQIYLKYLLPEQAIQWQQKIQM